MSNQQFSPPPLAERLISRALDEEDRSARLGVPEIARERSEYLFQKPEIGAVFSLREGDTVINFRVISRKIYSI